MSAVREKGFTVVKERHTHADKKKYLCKVKERKRERRNEPVRKENRKRDGAQFYGRKKSRDERRWEDRPPPATKIGIIIII